MKHIKKYLALLLALCFIAVMPLSAAAASHTWSAYDSYITGTWYSYLSYDSETKEKTSMSSSNSKMYIYSDGSASFYIGTKMYSASWNYTSKADSGPCYEITVKYDGSNLDLYMMYVTDSGSMSGDIVLLISDTLILYDRA